MGIILAGIVYKHVWSRQYTDWGRVHEQEVIEDTLLLQRDLQAIVRDLEGIVSLFKSSDFVSRNGFKAYVGPILEKQKFVKTFNWVPLISDKNRESYEKKMRQEGFPGFQIVQHYSKSGEIIPALKNKIYYPVHYVEPGVSNEEVLGFDIGSDPELLKILNESKETGEPAAMERIDLVSNSRENSSLYIVVPYYDGGRFPADLHDRAEKFKGFALGKYGIKEMVKEMVKDYLPKGLNLVVYADEEKNENRLFGQPIKDPPKQLPSVTNFSNRRWIMVWQATKAFRGGPKFTNDAYWFAGAILAVTLFLSIIFEIMASRTRQVENQVRLRTEELTQSNAKLMELNDLKNKFLGMASHDLRNPLASIKGYAKFLLDKGKNIKEDTRQEFLNTIYSASKNMVGLLADLLDISVIESGQLNLNLQTASMKHLAEDRVHLQKILAEKKEISIQMTLEAMPDFPFAANRMGQVIDNLLGNAIKFSPPGKDIHVRLAAKGEMARFSVTDEGPGISREERGRLFEHFQKLSARPTGGENSSGLGLAIARRIVEEHHGNIEVESEPGSGSTFIVEIPMQ